MERFIPFEWNNAEELYALCVDLDLIPVCFCTPSMLEYWKEVFSSEFTKGLTLYETQAAKMYNEQIMKHLHNSRYQHKILYDDRQLEFYF